MFRRTITVTCRLNNQETNIFFRVTWNLRKEITAATLALTFILGLLLAAVPPDPVLAIPPGYYAVTVQANDVEDLTIGAPATYTVSWRTDGLVMEDSCTGSNGLSGTITSSGSQVFQNVGLGTYTYTLTCDFYVNRQVKTASGTAIVHVVQPTQGPSTTPTPTRSPTITRTPTFTNTSTFTITPTETPVVAYPGVYQPGNAIFKSTAFLDTRETPYKYWMGGGLSYTHSSSISMTFFGGAVDIFYPYMPYVENLIDDGDIVSQYMGYPGLPIEVYLDGVLNTSFTSGPAGGVHVNTTPGLHTLKIENYANKQEQIVRCGIISQVVVYSNPTPFTPTFTPTNTWTPTSTPTPFPTPSYPKIYSLDSNKSPWKVVTGSPSQVTLSSSVTIKIPANGSVYYNVRRDNTMVKQADITVLQTTGACDMSLYYNGSLAYRQVIPGNPYAAAAGYPKFTIRPRPHETRIDTVMLKAGSGDCYVSNVTAYGVGISMIATIPVPTEEILPTSQYTTSPN